MIVPAAIKRKFLDLEMVLRQLGGEVERTVRGFCNSNLGFAYAERTKELESLAEKIETGRYAKWSDLDDLFACSVIVPTLKQEPYVLEFLRKAFLEDHTRERKDSKKSPDTFRFEASRFIGKLRPTKDSETSSQLYATKFEVQVRTAFEHACAVTTHQIYKGSRIDWKTKRLAAHLKAAVEQLDLFVLNFQTTSETIEEHNWPELEAKNKLARTFSKLVAEGKIAEEMAPKDWSRFAENLYALLESGYRGRRSGLSDHVNEALSVLETEIKAMTHIPHSISILQLSLGILVRNSVLELPIAGYTPLVTPELLEQFPKSTDLRPPFDFDT